MLSPTEWAAIGLSILVALVAVIASLPFAVALGWILSHKNFVGKSLVDLAVNLPLVLPPVVTGYLLLLAFGRNGWMGAWLNDLFGISLAFDWKGAALASAVVGFPLMVRSIRQAFSQVDRRLEDAARTFGASPTKVFWKISLPLARSGLIAGVVLGFARGLGEFGATIIIAGNTPGQTQTIPLYIYDQLETPGGMAQAQGVLMVSILLAGAAILLSNWLDRQGTNHARST